MSLAFSFQFVLSFMYIIIITFFMYFFMYFVIQIITDSREYSSSMRYCITHFQYIFYQVQFMLYPKHIINYHVNTLMFGNIGTF